MLVVGQRQLETVLAGSSTEYAHDNPVERIWAAFKAWLANAPLTIQGRVRQVHAFFRTRSPAQLLATAALHSSPWLSQDYMQDFWGGRLGPPPLPARLPTEGAPMSRLHQRAIGLAMVATVVVVLLPAAASVAAAATPLPEVIGPIPVTADSYPFGAADHTLVPQDLAKVGYVEDEYFVKGKANVYDWPAPGPAVVRTASAPYTTRILVRRPAKAAHFSGNVVVEMLNPSNLFDLNIGWALTHRQFIRNGDAWVGITAKPISVVALKNFNPQRYASLSFANPLPLDDPRNCQTVAAISAAARSGTSMASATRRPAATSTTTSTPSTRSRCATTTDVRSTTAISSRSRAVRSWGPCRSTNAPPRRRSEIRAASSTTWACRSSTSCRNRTTSSASGRGGRTATPSRTATATTRWPGQATPRRTSCTSGRHRTTSSKPAGTRHR